VTRDLRGRASAPVLLCYDGSEPAKQAIRQAAAILSGGPAIVLTVWESLGSALLRSAPSGATQLGRDFREISEDVVNELDEGTAKRAHATAAAGVEIAAAAGFDARPLARRALGHWSERSAVTIWQAVLQAAEEEDVALVVLGSRGRSGLKSALLGSVSYGVVHNSTRPLLIVPPPD
jgi:nucleotide-binding universal stress UspA family protein